MQRQFAPAGVTAGAFRLSRRGFVADEAEQVTARALRQAEAEMRAERPEHHADLVDRMAGDRDAANDDDAAPVLDLAEDAGELGVQRRVAAMTGSDVAEGQPLCLE